MAIVQEIEATDVVEKKLSKKATESTPTSSLKGNSAKLLARLTTILNQENFVKLNRSAVGEEIGLPKGSVGASITKLLQAGYLIEGGFGEFKLTRPKPGM